MAFTLNTYPVTWRAQYSGGKWKEEFLEKPHKKAAKEAAMSQKDRSKMEAIRNFYDDMPIVNYTTQYGLGCFEGLKAMPQKNGGLAIFRPERNAARFYRSMEGLYMPPLPEEMFLKACIEVIKKNASLGFTVTYKKEWE
ncbi:MAG: branched chain amino acid aminotransferase, partial [Treponema sp.]|nr:branched chain amino acid aminotransferase [Treponema sp.]